MSERNLSTGPAGEGELLKRGSWALPLRNSPEDSRKGLGAGNPRDGASGSKCEKSDTRWAGEKIFEETRKVNFPDLKKAGKLQCERHH